MELSEQALKRLGLAMLAVLGVLVAAIVALILNMSSPLDSSQLVASDSPMPAQSESPGASTSTPGTDGSPTATSPARPTARPSLAPTKEPQSRPGDEITNPIVIGSIPFEEKFRKFRATGDRRDPDCFADDRDGLGRTMWFAFTPRRARTLAATAFGTHLAEIYVGTVGRAGRFNMIDCNDWRMLDGGAGSGVVFDAEAGVTYLIMMRVVGYDPGDDEFRLWLKLDVGSDPPEISIDVDPVGAVNELGIATITGVVTCGDGRGVIVFLDQGNSSARGDEGAQGPCRSDGRRWVVQVPDDWNGESDERLFGEGSATATVEVTLCDDLDCYYHETKASVMLRLVAEETGP